MTKKRTSLMIDSDVIANVATLAEMQGTSMNQLIGEALAALVERNSGAIEKFRAERQVLRAKYQQISLFDGESTGK